VRHHHLLDLAFLRSLSAADLPFFFLPCFLLDLLPFFSVDSGSLLYRALLLLSNRLVPIHALHASSHEDFRFYCVWPCVASGHLLVCLL